MDEQENRITTLEVEMQTLRTMILSIQQDVRNALTRLFQASVALIIAILVHGSATIWFFSADHAQQQQMSKILEEMAPKTAEMWYGYKHGEWRTK